MKNMIGIRFPKNIDPDQILSVKELEQQTGMSNKTIRDWIFRGVIKKTKIGPRMIGVRWKHFLEIVKDGPNV